MTELPENIERILSIIRNDWNRYFKTCVLFLMKEDGPQNRVITHTHGVIKYLTRYQIKSNPQDAQE